MGTVAKIDKWNYSKFKNFYASKETTEQTRQPRELKNIFGNHITDNRLTSRVYKELQLN